MCLKCNWRKWLLFIIVVILTSSARAVVSDDGIDWQSPCGSYGWNNLTPKKWFGISEEIMSWTEAQVFCNTFGHGLATLKTDVENDAFHDAWGKQ